MMENKSFNLVEVRNLKKYFTLKSGAFSTRKRTVYAVDGIDFHIGHGETLGLAGESGSGKTTVGKAILRIIEPSGGEVYFEGINILELNPAELRKLRSKMLIVFQDTQSSLNPRMTVDRIIERPLRIFGTSDRNERKEKVCEMLIKVDIDIESINKYPHEFSGGQIQRIGIARALALRPKFIVLDEPTSALDVSIQSQILNLLKKLQRDLNLAYLFISHNLTVIKHISDRVAIMYLGKIVEMAPKEALFDSPQHPYTKALISAIPVPSSTMRREKILLKGDVPSAFNPPKGCRFNTRCEKARLICREVEPDFLEIKKGHYVACHQLL